MDAMSSMRNVSGHHKSLNALDDERLTYTLLNHSLIKEKRHSIASLWIVSSAARACRFMTGLSRVQIPDGPLPRPWSIGLNPLPAAAGQ